MVSTVGPLTTSWSGRPKMVSWWSGGGTRRDLAVPSSVPALVMENSRLERVSSRWVQSVLASMLHFILSTIRSPPAEVRNPTSSSRLTTEGSTTPATPRSSWWGATPTLLGSTRRETWGFTEVLKWGNVVLKHQLSCVCVFENLSLFDSKSSYNVLLNIHIYLNLLSSLRNIKMK